MNFPNEIRKAQESMSLRKKISLLLFVLAGASFLLFGLRPYENVHPGSDAKDYNAYAKHIAVSGLYSTDGETFSAMREPAYPMFLAALYKVFGVENYTAVKVAQVLLLFFSGLSIYLSFGLYGYARAGVFAGGLFVLLPPYAHYANLLLVEVYFTFLLAASLYMTLFLLRRDRGILPYVILGLTLALMTLARMHMLFFPILIFALLLYYRKSPRSLLISTLAYLLVIAGWASIVYGHTGQWTLTSGRQETHLYARAVRAAELSYAGNARYYMSWLKRSMSGGEEDAILLAYDSQPLSLRMEQERKDGKTASDIRAENQSAITGNAGRFLFGNVIEWGKLMWIEHLHEPRRALTREVRAGMYFLIYGVFLAGLAGFLVSKARFGRMLLIALGAFILYHWIVLPFFDVVPRLNTPYLGLYLSFGIAGIAAYYHHRTTISTKSMQQGIQPARGKRKVVGIIMTYNCAPYITRAYERLDRSLFDEIICVDDASTDDSVKVAEKLGLKVFTHPHTGYGGNLLFGLRKAAELGGTSMIEVHGDGQFDPSATPLAIQKIEEEGCDIVLGNRFHGLFEPLRDGMSLVRYFGNLAFSTFGRIAVGLKPADLFTGFRAYSHRVVETIDFSNNAQEYSFSFQILAQAKYCGLRFDEVPTRGDYRTSHTSMSLWKGVGAIFLTVRTALLYWLALTGIKRDIFANLKRASKSR